MVYDRFFLRFFVFTEQYFGNNKLLLICPADVRPCQRTFLQTYATVADSTPTVDQQRIPPAGGRLPIAPRRARIGGSGMGVVTVRLHQEGIATA
jgi:hypothetical protein